MQGEIEGVIGDRMLALDADVAVDRFGQAAKQQRMIDQVWREVEENASAGANALAPCTRLQLGAKTVVVRFKSHQTPETAARNKLLHGLKVAIVAAVLVNGEQSSV